MRIHLVKQVSKKGDKNYTTYRITLPKSLIEALGFSECDELELTVKEIDGKQAIVLYKP